MQQWTGSCLEQHFLLLEDPYSEAEVSIHSSLRSPRILRLPGYFNKGKVFYLCLQAVVGGDLYSALSTEGPFKEIIVCSYTFQVCTM